MEPDYIPFPKCTHAWSRRTVLVSSHEDLDAIPEGEAMASEWVCPKDECVEDAKAWVLAVTGREAHVSQRRGDDATPPA